jgi:RPA family protein
MKLLENINLDTVNISRIETIIKQQNECLLEMYKLLLFDETTAEPDNNKWAKAFLETQIKALEHIQKITEKHKQHFSKKEDKYNNDDDNNNDDDDIEQESLF